MNKQKGQNTRPMNPIKFRKTIAWVLIQAVLLCFFIFCPFRIPLNIPCFIRYLGFFFLFGGILIVIISEISLKRNLTTTPEPVSGGYQVTSGLYHFVRHPMYLGIILVCLGFGILMSDLIKILLTSGVFIFLDIKSRAEEKWLEKTFSGYVSYKKQVTKKFIPWLY